MGVPHRTQHQELPYLHCKWYRPDMLSHCAVYRRRLELSILATTAAPGGNAVPTGPASPFGLPTNITRYMPTYKQMRSHAVNHHNKLDARSSEHNGHRRSQFVH